MSRIIIKNLPKAIKEERLREIFSTKGDITDVAMKYTKEGIFRKFAFIGFKDREEAELAVKHFNKSFIDTSKIQVEIAKNFGDSDKPRAWSKYSKESSAYQNKIKKEKTIEYEKNKEEINKKLKQERKAKKEKAREEKVDELLGDLKDDPGFQEFLEVHKNRSTKALWSNDAVTTQENQEKMELDSDADDDSGNESSKDDSEEKEEEENSSDEEEVKKEAAKKGLSDLDYLKSKVTKNKLLSSDSEDNEEDTEKVKTKGSSKGKKEAQQSDDDEDDDDDEDEDDDDDDDDDEEDEDEESDQSDDDIASESENASKTKITSKQRDEDSDSDLLVLKKTKESPENQNQPPDGMKYVIKMRGLPLYARDKQIMDFFAPLKPTAISIPKNAKGKKAFNVATVEFSSLKETDEAMRKNKNFIGPKRIYLYKMKVKAEKIPVSKPRLWESRTGKDEGEEEPVAESGRLFLRNLAYVCKEEDLEELFGKYGPVTEVHLPIDKFTKKIKGFAFVTYMIPEHAVKAFAELDGSAFQGRMLHILPAKGKKEDDPELSDSMSYKEKKEAKQKASASSSHNWNTLFLGANAVADVTAEMYGTTKSNLLDAEAKQSLGVRMALAETQIVSETRDFLIENGVQLDAFSQAAAARSKTVILIKNLPAHTKGEEIRDVFAKYGTLGRVILPPSGVTAIVEFMEPTEARKAFKSLAYTKFHHVPLYLEWAPMNVFKTVEQKKEENTKQESDKEESESEDEVEPDSTLFVKNLNFDSNEESLQEVFSKCGPIRNITIAKKKDMKNPGQMLSMGYGFIEFKKRASAQKALKTLQHTTVDDHQIELKVSSRTTIQKTGGRKKQDTKKKQKSSKILVRNIPFEAKVKEVKELFTVFGELKSVRLPQKLSGTGTHRGFGFVDFLSKQDAKRAFNAMCHSTHLYGRRLVLEWAESEETVDQLRKKTADHFHSDAPAQKRLKKQSLLEDLKASDDK